MNAERPDEADFHDEPTTDVDDPEAYAALAVGHLLPGQQINGRYVIEHLVGEGGMGQVYRVRDELRPDQPLALKVLRGGAIHESFLGLFRAEFRTLTGLRHPHIAEVFDFEQYRGTSDYFFTMQFIEGDNAFTATRGWTWQQVVDVVVQICRALAYIHTRDIIHADLKPQNMLITRDGQVKLVDFGVAHAQKANHGQRMATPGYSAPERFREDDEIDRRADLYSLGITMFQLLCRRLPTLGLSLTEIARWHSTAQLEFEEADAAMCPEWLRDIIMRLTAREPADRLRNANEVIAALNAGGGTSYALETTETRDSYVSSSRFVGRDKEMARVDAFVHERLGPGARENPAALFATGPSGVGKSRLLREVRYQLQLARTTLVEGHCYEGSLSSYAPLASIFRQLLASLSSLGASDLIVAHEPAIARVIPDWKASPHLVPILDGAAVPKAACDFLIAAARRLPFVLCIHDLQWVNETSLDVLNELVTRSRDPAQAAPLAVLGSYRDKPAEYIERTVSTWLSASMAEELALAPLDAHDVTEIMTSMLGIGRFSDTFIDALTRETGGNPLFLTELVRTMAEKGSIVHDLTGWGVRGELTSEEIARDVSSMFLDRLTSLRAEELRLMQLLAVYGEPASLPFLDAALIRTGAPAGQPAELLATLLRGRLVLPSSGDVPRYGVAHARLRSAAHDLLQPESLRALHLALAQELEATQALLEPARIAQHYAGAEHKNAAVHWYGKAARLAFERYESKRVLDLVDLAVSCGASGEELGHLASLAAEAGRMCGMMARAEAYGRTAMTLLPPNSPDWLQASRVVIATFNPMAGLKL